MIKPKIKAIAFDVDNVLVYSEILHVEAWNTILPRYGIQIKDIDYQSGIGLTDYEFAAQFMKNSSPAEIQQVLKDKWTEFLNIVRQKIMLMPSAKQMLDKLSGKYRFCAASSSNLESVNLMLSLTGIIDKFEFLLTREDVTNHKPAPDVYLLAAKRFGVLPSECLAVEDSPAGILSAKSAGLYCVAITSSFPKNKLSKADKIIDNLSELEQLL